MKEKTLFAWEVVGIGGAGGSGGDDDGGGSGGGGSVRGGGRGDNIGIIILICSDNSQPAHCALRIINTTS